MTRANYFMLFGSAILLIGIAMIYFAFPIVEWLAVDVSEYNFSYRFPANWSLQQGEQQKIGPELIRDLLEDANGISVPEQTRKNYYSSELFDIVDRAQIGIIAYPSDTPGLTPRMLAEAMQKMHELGEKGYAHIRTRPVKVNLNDGIQRIETFLVSCSDCQSTVSNRIILISTYLVIDETVYHFTLKEDKLLNLMRDYKIYMKVIDSFEKQ